MARHRDYRNVQAYDYDDDDDEYDHSYDETSYGASPATLEMYTYNKDGRHNISSHFPINSSIGINEQDFEEQVDQDDVHERKHEPPDDSVSTTVTQYTTSNTVEIPGSSKTHSDSPKPQRQPRSNRRSKKEANPVNESTVAAGVQNVDSSKSLTNVDKVDLNATASPVSIQSRQRQNSPAFRTAHGAGDSATAAMPASKGTKTTRVTQLSVDVQSLPTTPKTPNSRPNSGSAVKTPQNTASPADANKKIQAMKAKLEAAFKKRQATSKSVINLVVVGHVDAGKSTLMGHVLHMIEPTCETRSGRTGGGEDDRPIPFAWNLDETDAERDRGVTIDVAQTCFETENHRVVLLDAPGHKDFIPNMISGAAQADVALLVVNATRGEFETGFDAGGQTREHAMLVRSLGVQQLVVAVNKMDTVNWSQERYDAVIKKSRPFLKQTVRFTAIQFVPVSGLLGVNLVKRPDPTEGHPLTAWYTGPALLECIDQLSMPARQIDKPFRFCVSDFFRQPNSPGVTVAGIVVAGGILNGSRVICKPAGVHATVKGISVAAAGGASDSAFAGDCCTLVLAGVDMSVLSTGDVVCDPVQPILSTNKLQARILLLSKEAWIPRGAAMMFHLQNVSETAIVSRLLCLVDRATGEEKTRNPRVLNNSCCADVELELEKSICMELYKDFKELGRFTLRRDGKSIASGTVTKLLRENGATLG